MTLVAGSTVGPYEVLGPLGSGGMGDVYRARDTRLGRTVAIKVLRSQLSGNDELRVRFEREARAISSLSHPHICTLYDVGRDGAVEYLVMEVLEGEPLSAKLARGPLPVSQVVRYGAQIADALDHAHRAGIVHRDLKPANIMITPSGAKLLDFGLAKLAEAPARVFSELSAPATHALTAEGAIVGTFHYMSPEQIDGQPLDHRSDMFALGIVLYEMATGRRPFSGSSPATVIATVLSSDPVSPRALQPEIPAELERIIMTALEKNPADRWQSAQDVARQLRWLADPSSSTQVVRKPATHWRTPALFAAMLLAGALLGWAVTRFASRPETHRTLRLHFVAPPAITITSSLDTNNFAISHDGTRLAFVALADGKRALYVRDLASEEPVRVDGSEGALAPFWSPDDNWIGFAARGKLWKANLAERGSPIALCNVASNGAVSSWGGHQILFADAPGAGQRPIMSIPDHGGTPRPATTLDQTRKDWRHSWPLFLDDGKHFLYLAFATDSPERRLLMQSLDSHEVATVLSNVSQAAVAGDEIFFVRDGTLLRQKFDASAGRVEGEPSTIASEVRYFYATAASDFDASANGVIVYRTSTGAGELVEVNRSGAALRRLDDGENFFTVSLSPDGRRAAVSIMDHNGLGDIWIYDLARQVRDRVSADPGMEVYPVWAPDGNALVYSRTGGGLFPYLVRRAMNAPGITRIMRPGAFDVGSSFSPDGAWLYFTRRDPQSTARIFRLSMTTKQVERVIGSEFRETDGMASPDGKWLAFATDATGKTEVYVQELGGERRRIRISTNGGRLPRWAPDGTALFFIAGAQLMSAAPGADGWNNPVLTTLFAVPPDMPDYAPTREGTFLVCRYKSAPADEPLNVIIRE